MPFTNTPVAFTGPVAVTEPVTFTFPVVVSAPVFAVPFTVRLASSVTPPAALTFTLWLDGSTSIYVLPSFDLICSVDVETLLSFALCEKGPEIANASLRSCLRGDIGGFFTPPDCHQASIERLEKTQRTSSPAAIGVVMVVWPPRKNNTGTSRS
jgi:hypothetical protein